MPAKKKEAPPTANLGGPKKSATKGLGLKISPAQRDEAVRVLEEYVRERVELAKNKAKLDLHGASQLMDALYQFKEELGERIKTPTEKGYDTLRFAVIPEFMDEQDIRNINYEGIGRVECRDDIQTTVHDKTGLNKWLEDEDLEDLIQRTVNAQTLAATLRQRIKDGKSMPPAAVATVKPIVRAQITRSK